jgi:hypothetical protein
LHQQTANSEAETTHTMYKLNLFTKLLLGWGTLIVPLQVKSVAAVSNVIRQDHSNRTICSSSISPDSTG